MDEDKVFTSYFEKVRALQEEADKKKNGRWYPYLQRAKKIGKYLLNTLVSVICSIVGGWALSTVWGWYVVPKFHLPALGIVNAVGLFILMGFFRVYSDLSRELEKKPVYQASEHKDLIKNGLAIFTYLVALFGAWVWHFFL